MDPIDLSLFASRISAVCAEMGAQLQRPAFLPNIRDRLDFSCAVFDVRGALCAQAAHTPMHLASMAYAMSRVVADIHWSAGDVVIFNDPFLGGARLLDVTMISPVYRGAECVGFVASRTYHTDIGAETQGSMSISTCPLAVTVAVVYYVFRCLMPAHTPPCAGRLRPIEIDAPAGSLLKAARPAAVAAGNVETSTRVVDVVLGALARAIPQRIPAASHGSMNNVAMGDSGASPWGYYETIGGGVGAGLHGSGLSAVQTHMINTRNTPIEVLEQRYPLRIRRYELRCGSGGAGRRRGDWGRGGNDAIPAVFQDQEPG